MKKIILVLMLTAISCFKPTAICTWDQQVYYEFHNVKSVQKVLKEDVYAYKITYIDGTTEYFQGACRMQ